MYTRSALITLPHGEFKFLAERWAETAKDLRRSGDLCHERGDKRQGNWDHDDARLYEAAARAANPETQEAS